jgi:preprotein translocase subunit YajC
VHTFLLSLAQAATGSAPASGGGQAQGPAGCAGGGGTQSLLFMVLMIAVFYFMLIRPQQKKAKEHQGFLGGLKKGDQVVTRGGVIGRITGVTDTMVTLEIQEKVRVRVLKSYIEGAHREGAAPAAAAAPPKDKDKDKDKDDKQPATTT